MLNARHACQSAARQAPRGVRLSARATAAAAAGSASRPTRSVASQPAPPPLVLHVHEHCHFSTRTRLVFGWVRLPNVSYQFHGYGAGADPEKCEGHGYDVQSGGTVPIMGKKMCPVLCGEGVPVRPGLQGLGESLEICSYAAGPASPAHIAPATGRADVSRWLDGVADTRKALERPRLIRMPIPDFGDPRDLAYTCWTHTRQGFDYDQAVAETPQLLAALHPALEELSTMLRGRDQERGGMPTLNSWGVSIDGT